MSDNVPMHNLLRSQRARRERPWGLWAVLAITVLIGMWWFAPWQAWQTGTEDIEKSLDEAMNRARQAVVSARRPIEVRKGPKKQKGPDPAWSATWADGDAKTLKGKLAENQSVYVALRERGLPAASIQAMVSGLTEKFDFRRSRPGDIWTADVDGQGHITRFRYKTSPEDIWETVRQGDGGYETRKVDVPIDKQLTTIAGVVSGSLWESMMKAGENPKLIYRFADIFAYSIDFNRETQPGDQFAMVVEKVMLDGEFLRYGHIRAAEYVNKGEVFRGFRFDPEKQLAAAVSDGSQSDEQKANNGEGETSQASYFDAHGRNLKRQFLKSPIASVRVTSGFGKRYHPVLEKQKMHRGVDYGAPTGTAVRSVADGTVTFADWKGANGQLIVIDHANGYKTLYAHLSDIESGIHPGAKVSKKTIIGEVGSTGRSTGPHLHYGMTRHGSYINPRKIDAARAEPLKGKDKKRFQREVAHPMLERLGEARRKAGLSIADSNPLASDDSTNSPDAGSSDETSPPESRAAAQTDDSPG
jgi:murein DD-endopeptidase MepM/ murein hydrolase activator NlpD